jgi:hypothetical protein
MEIQVLTDNLAETRKANEELRSTLQAKIDKHQATFAHLQNAEDKARSLREENALLNLKNEELERRNRAL